MLRSDATLRLLVISLLVIPGSLQARYRTDFVSGSSRICLYDTWRGQRVARVGLTTRCPTNYQAEQLNNNNNNTRNVRPPSLAVLKGRRVVSSKLECIYTDGRKDYLVVKAIGEICHYSP